MKTADDFKAGDFTLWKCGLCGSIGAGSPAAARRPCTACGAELGPMARLDTAPPPHSHEGEAPAWTADVESDLATHYRRRESRAVLRGFIMGCLAGGIYGAVWAFLIYAPHPWR